jgi:hypothetical protein
VKFAGGIMIFGGALLIMFTIRTPPGTVASQQAAANPAQFQGTSATGATTTAGYISGGA